MTERTLGRYHIVERLGQGGMGVVYRAEDPRLDREVALKLIRDDALGSEEARRRFRLEARVLSRLLHPGIATLFDLDSDDKTEFLVMEYVPGQTLAELLAGGPLPESRARAIAVEISEALQAAHEQGVIHRDLKPGNVVITPRGRAKVLDFGLAHLVAGGAGSVAMSSAAGTPSFAGTVPYMAPEQVQQRGVDARTDLYALGLLLHEMITGRPVYEADDPVATMYRIVHEPAPSLREARPGVSRDLDAIVTRCLDKTPDRRFPDAAALARALRGATASESMARATPPDSSEATEGYRSLVVLPFENRSGDPAQEFFADGLTETLITELAQIGALRVISRTSAMRYKGGGRALGEIARELGVQAVVEGSAMQVGNRVRITVQLLDALADRTLWARRYDRDLTDLLALQSEVATAIAEEIRVKVTPSEQQRMRPRGPVDPAAHVAYLRGRFLWNRYAADSVRESIACFEEALRADPRYALAYAGLADSYLTLGSSLAMPPQEAYSRAKLAAEQGLAIDDSLGELHASLAQALKFHGWDWPAAERAFLRGIELSPGYAIGRYRYGILLGTLGRHEEAIAISLRALELDPLSLFVNTGVGDVMFFARRYEDSVMYYRKCHEMDPTFPPGNTDLARSLEHLGQVEEALELFRRGTRRADGVVPSSPGLAIMLWRAGRHDEARRTIEEVKRIAAERFVTPFGIASFHAVAGDTTEALDWLERGYQQHDG
ncbi:MAG: protein kinase, partial [Candidatus Eisenbacteria bacterium]